MGNATLNGNAMNARLIAVNPRFDVGNAKTYLAMNKDGLDSIGATVEGKLMVLTGKGLKQQVSASDILMINGKPAEVKFQENEINGIAEGATDLVSSSAGASALLGGLFGGGAITYGLSLFGLMTLPILPAMLIAGAGAALLGLAGVALFGAWKSHKKVVDEAVANRLA